jgi:hypothetical protein
MAENYPFSVKNALFYFYPSQHQEKEEWAEVVSTRTEIRTKWENNK